MQQDNKRAITKILPPVGLIFTLILLTLMVACGSVDEKTALTSKPEPTVQPKSTATEEPLIITIGNLTDVTGPSAMAQNIINMALYDLINYYNQNDIIPGTEFQVIDYDTRMETTRFSVGYQWLKSNGADFILTCVPGVIEEIGESVNQDEVVLISYVAEKETMDPPGYIFCPGTTFNDDLGYTTLKWIAANDTDFPENRPATIGGAGWDEPYMQALLSGAEQYCMEHPEHFEWKGKHFTDYTFIWDKQIEALKDCDYVIPPEVMLPFVHSYKDKGYSTTFVGLDGQMAFLDSGDRENEIAVNGMLFFKTNPWWTDDDPDVAFVLELLKSNHPDQYQMIIESGVGYLSITSHEIMLEMVAHSLELDTDKTDINSHLLYEASQGFSTISAGAEHTYTENKRTSANYLRAYEMDVNSGGIYLIEPSEWYPITHLP